MASEKERQSTYRFGLFEVDRRSGELRKAGHRLRLRGRPIDILVMLLERPGDVVTREELRERLWPADTFVDFDHGLHSAVNRLRDALGDSADNPRFIETIPRRGYRFIGNVSAPAPPVAAPATASAATQAPLVQVPEAAPMAPLPVPTPVTSPALQPDSAGRAQPPPQTSPRRFPMWAMASAVVVVLAVGFVFWRNAASAVPHGPLSLAVLPFENLSGDPEQEYLTDGFTEEVIAELGMLAPDQLSVIGRTTSMSYKGQRKTIGQIGSELGVKYLLEGSVRRSGPRLRITAQLVDSQSMARIWSDTYERDIGDVLAVQKEVASEIAISLGPRLVARGEKPPPVPSTSFEAYELYMRGRFFRQQATEDGARKAIEYYERALKTDPNYAAAHAALADAYRLLGAPGLEVESPSSLLPKAKAAAERALQLDSHSPEAHAVLSMVKFNFEWDLAGAEREVKEALRLNPSFAQAHQYYSGILTTMGRMDEAIASARRAMELDPLAATASTTLGVRYYYAKRPEEAIQQFTKTLETRPGFPVAHWGLAQCYRLQGKFAEQIDQLRSAVQLSNNSTYMRAHLAYGYAVAGDSARALALRKEIEAEGATRYLAPYHLALIDAGLGDTEAAIQSLERAFADRSGWLVFLPVEPEFEGMQNLPAFQQLLSQVKPQN